MASSKKVKDAVSKALDTTARSAIVNAWTTGMATLDNTGSIVTQVCNIANKYVGKDGLSEPDMDLIVADIQTVRKWPEKTVKSRQSEVKAVLRACQKLPDAIAAYKAETDKCDWHTSLKLARELMKQTGNVKKAVAEVIAAVSKPGKVSTPEGRAAAALKNWFVSLKDDASADADTKRANIREAAKLLKLTLKLTVTI